MVNKVVSGVPEPKTQPSNGSLTNMPTQAELKQFNEVEKPVLMRNIQKSWGNIVRKARELNGRIRYVDKSS